MKKLMTCIFGVLLNGFAFAQSEVGRTNLWQVPNIKEVKLQFEALDPKLNKICSEYRDLVVSESGQQVFDREDIERLRGETPNVFDKVFTAKFRISFSRIQEVNQAAVQEANAKVDVLRAKDLLPYYTLKLGGMSSSFQPNGAVVVYWMNNSLSAISNSLGLKPLSVNILPGNASSVLVVKGKDTACDLIAGSGWLEFDARTLLTPDSADFQHLEKVYDEIAGLNNQFLSKKKTPIGRASLFGYKMENLLKDHHVEGVRAEDVLGYYVDTIFDAEMSPNQNWQKIDGEWKILIPKEVYSTVKVSIRR